MLVATLPQVHRRASLEKIISHPFVDAVRYNTGANSPYSPKETLLTIQELANLYGKKLWVDLKGRQLRIVHWAAPVYGKILLNHNLRVSLPARVHFRDGGWSNLVAVFGNEIFVDPPPAEALGQGQAVNIVGENVKVAGYSIEEDFSYIEAACDLGIFDFMLSYVEGEEDIAEVAAKIKSVAPDAKPHFALKIESRKGVKFVQDKDRDLSAYTLVAATDDLITEFDDNRFDAILPVQSIVAKNGRAIFASNIFKSIEYGDLSLADVLSLRFAQLMGYHDFMLSDEISDRYFDEAMEIWQKFCSVCYC